MADHWLDVMPPIPLARAVPVVLVDAGEREVREQVTLFGGQEPGCAGFGGRGVQDLPTYVCARQLDARLRVDLDDPQGFAYALRFYVLRRTTAERGWERNGGLDTAAFCALRDRHLRGETTDADKLVLARACRAVVEGR